MSDQSSNLTQLNGILKEVLVAEITYNHRESGFSICDLKSLVSLSHTFNISDYEQ